ncbi:hypothetical protein EYF80_046871 [Liparis tanakae]|uniref:Uncharacterized protein n=1 Tax=Liparis tanakae TaxID=230148 RepID=A0A4Z2FPZ6_9TELE|nr:hypothetical protein EYF80_046871 [Liparis tanakae]
MLVNAERSANQAPRAYLGLDVGVVVVLEEQGGGLGVVLACGDVQGGQADLPFGVVLQEDGHHLVVALLEGDGQREKQRSEDVSVTRRGKNSSH